MKARKIDKDKNRLVYLAKMISKYKHCWGENPSNRLTGWVDEFNSIKENSRVAFTEWSKESGCCIDSTGHDLLA